LVRAGLNRLARLTPPRAVIRYERSRPGELVHLDIKPLARILRVGHRIHGDRRHTVKGAGYEYALGYAKERHAFGKPIIQNQAIAFMLADMATEIDASRLLIWRAAWLARNGGYKNAEGSMSKLKAARTAVWVTERAIQILGGYGYTREYPVERMHRDAKIFDIFEGTEQIQQLVIARAISGLRIE
jgi:alkylation response protein AidB-like acyl-CoA dehydrogenase